MPLGEQRRWRAWYVRRSPVAKIWGGKVGWKKGDVGLDIEVTKKS